MATDQGGFYFGIPVECRCGRVNPNLGGTQKSRRLFYEFEIVYTVRTFSAYFA